MLFRLLLTALATIAPFTLTPNRAASQDVPGIEICTVDKTMERRTSCLQSNVFFLQKTITKLGNEQQLRLDAANRQIEALRNTVVALQKTVDDLQTAQKKQPAGNETAAPTKEGAK